MRHPLEVHRTSEQARVPKLASGAAAEEPQQLGLDGLPPPLRLVLQAAERAEISLRVNERLDRADSDSADQLVFQVLHANIEPQALHLGPGPRRAEAGPGQTAQKDVLLAEVAQPREPEASTSWTELLQIARKRMRASNRQDHKTFRDEVPAAAGRQRLDRDLVAD